MRTSPWFVAGLLAALGAGAAFLASAIWKPGRLILPENPPGNGQAYVAGAKKKLDLIQESWRQLQAEKSGLTAMPGTEGEHRVFVSAQLVYLPQNPEPVQPLDRRMKTGDGIEVGWKMKYGLDPADPDIWNQDPDGDGFTNLEEYAATPPTHPLRKEDSPAKESKLRVRAAEEARMNLIFTGRLGDLFALRLQLGGKRKDVKLTRGQKIWILVRNGEVETFEDAEKAKAASQSALAAQQAGHLIPLTLVDYTEKIEMIKDATAGGVVVERNNSKITVERGDKLSGRQEILFSSPGTPRPIVWEVGDILLFSPVEGVGVLGPLRIGQVFSHEGKQFSILGREGKRVEVADAEGKKFSIPPEPAVPSGPAPSSSPAK